MSDLLKFKNGKFRVMLVGDPHEKADDTSKNDTAKIKDYLALQYAAIKSEKPNLVILMGDNASADDKDELYTTLLRMTKPYYDYDIPFSFVLGNHDLECKVNSIDEQYDVYRKLPGCILPEKEEINSFGDYCVSVFSEQEDTPALNIWHFFSGNKAEKKYHSNYDFVKEEQIRLYRAKAEEMKQKYGKKVPAIAVQHIPVPEVHLLLKKSNLIQTMLYAVKGQDENNGFYVLDRSKGVKGYMGEKPCPPQYNSGEFEAWKATGDIFAAFFGHDHMNDFEGMVDGIILGQCKTASFRVYGDGLMQGVKIIDFTEKSPRTIQTKMVRHRELIGNECNSIHGAQKHLRDAVSVRLELSAKTAAVAAVAVICCKLIKKMKND